MEDAIHDRPFAVFSRIGGYFTTNRDDSDTRPSKSNGTPDVDDYKSIPAYRVTVRKGITTFDDAMAAACGLKKGEIQVLNLTDASEILKQKIVDFISGVKFAEGATWEQVGEDIYIVVPRDGDVEVAPASPRMERLRN